MQVPLISEFKNNLYATDPLHPANLSVRMPNIGISDFCFHREISLDIFSNVTVRKSNGEEINWERQKNDHQDQKTQGIRVPTKMPEIEFDREAIELSLRSQIKG